MAKKDKSSKGKKRKVAQEETTDTITTDTSTDTTTDTTTSSSTQGATLVFKSGPAPPILQFTSNAPASDLPNNFKVTQDEASNSTTITGSTDTCTYTNVTVSPPSDDSDSDNDQLPAAPLTTTFSAVYDESTNTFTVYHEDNLSTSLRSLTQNIDVYKPVVSDHSLSASSLKDRRDALYKSFGSSKKLKVLKAQAANQVTVDAVVAGSTMYESMSSVTQSKSNSDFIKSATTSNALDPVALALESSRKLLLPPYNLSAKKPQDVYNARDIIGPETWAGISRVVDACSHKESWLSALLERDDYPESILKELKLIGDELKGGKDKGNDKDKIKVLVFLRHCWKFHNYMKKNTVRKSVEEVALGMGVPEYAASRILELFTQPLDGGGYGVMKQLKDKKCVHMLLLMMMSSEGCQVGNIKPLVKDMKMEVGAAMELLRQAGCTVKKGKVNGEDVLGVELKVPVVFPGVKRGRG
ncbi:hypothetical protein TrVE_jg9877 [Triparma verrucosa]|uniref:Uncharacterized protein n=1 Tax=Triparma verrucosa TaxID=1606542 RepID=A0A9W7DMR7_9STRA|nr:hypothetical protein TrVE_jg9877 [Triparma verrucosa]